MMQILSGGIVALICEPLLAADVDPVLQLRLCRGTECSDLLDHRELRPPRCRAILLPRDVLTRLPSMTSRQIKDNARIRIESKPKTTVSSASRRFRFVRTAYEILDNSVS